MSLLKENNNKITIFL